MSTTTVPLCEVTSEEVADAVRQGLDPATTCRPGRESTRAPSPARGPMMGSDRPDTVSDVVVTSSNRVLRAEGAIPRRSGRTHIVRSGGPPGVWPGALKLVDRVSIARKVRQVLRYAPGLG